MPVNSDELKHLILSTDVFNSQFSDILHSNFQNENSQKAIVATINTLLNAPKTRAKGLELLYANIEHCSSNILEENSLKWVVFCLVNLKGVDQLREVKFKTLAKVIEICHVLPGFSKKFVSDYLPDTLKAILATNNNNELKWGLNCLIQSMQNHPSWFGNHREKIEPFLLKFLDSNNENVVREAAIAFVYFQQTGGAGSEGVNHTSNFLNSFKKLCATVHSLYNIFFESISQVNDTEKVHASPIIFGPLPSNFDSIQILQLTSRRIVNCLIFLKYMIIKKFPATKQIVPKYLIDIISRGLAIHVCLDQEVSMETTYLSVFTNNVQINLLQLLRAGIVGFSVNLLPFSFNITKSIINTLKRSQTCRCFSSDSIYQEWAYKLCKLWLNSSKNYLPTNILEMLLSIITKDVTPVQKKVQLNIKISGKKKNKQQQQQNSEQTDDKQFIARKVVKQKTCLQALDTLHYLLKSTAITVKPQIMNDLYDVLIETVLDLQGGRKVHPYNEPDCQVELYKILGVMFEQKDYFPPLHTVIQLLNNGLCDQNKKIAEICADNLTILEKIAQPVCVSLELPKSSEERHIQAEDLLQLNENRNQNETLENAIDEIIEEINEENEAGTKEDEENFSVMVNADSPIPSISEVDSESRRMKDFDDEIPIVFDAGMVERLEEEILSGKRAGHRGENVLEISDDEEPGEKIVENEEIIILEENEETKNKTVEDNEEIIIIEDNNEADSQLTQIVELEPLGRSSIPEKKTDEETNENKEEPPEKKQKLRDSQIEEDLLEAFKDVVQ